MLAKIFAALSCAWLVSNEMYIYVFAHGVQRQQSILTDVCQGDETDVLAQGVWRSSLQQVGVKEMRGIYICAYS